ncbi:MAG: hypothetical protein HOI03_00740 [Candidatus Marinimicrobia bacterium]|jgi:hypothetical protein|nr:hypothetical protein [Candidatus Neomarinimicrobiota bacterium]
MKLHYSLFLIITGLLWGQNKTISVFDFMSNGLKSNEKALEIDYSTEVKKTFNNYIKMLNDEDAENISQFFYFDRNIWNSGPVFHIGENSPIVFKNPKELDSFFKKWKNSPKNKNIHIEIEHMDVVPISGGKKSKVYSLDATSIRRNINGEIIRNTRNLYYFQTDRVKGIKGLFTNWKEWKIYLVSEVKIET